MKTETKNISELEPGDKIYLPWLSDQDKPEWHKLPEVVTVKRLEGLQIIIEESGGICLTAVEQKEFQVVQVENPEAGDVITFNMEWFNALRLKEYREFSETVVRISKDPMKFHKPKCIVIIENEEYGIPFSEVIQVQKKKIQESKPQLELF